MKITKRVLGILLALAMGLGLFAPMAMAAESDAPVIVSLTPDPANKLNLSTTKKQTLRVQAASPSDDSGVLEYQWYEGEVDKFGHSQNTRAIAGATDSSLTVSCAAKDIDAFPFVVNKCYYAVITNRYSIGGEEKTAQAYTKTFTVRFYTSFFDSFLCLWQMPSKDATLSAGEKILAYLAVIALTPFVPMVYFAGLLGISPF